MRRSSVGVAALALMFLAAGSVAATAALREDAGSPDDIALIDALEDDVDAGRVDPAILAFISSEPVAWYDAQSLQLVMSKMSADDSAKFVAEVSNLQDAMMVANEPLVRLWEPYDAKYMAADGGERTAIMEEFVLKYAKVLPPVLEEIRLSERSLVEFMKKAGVEVDPSRINTSPPIGEVTG